MEAPRMDVHVYNDSGAWMITSEAASQRTTPLNAETDVWSEAVEAGVMVPITLVQDDPFNVRIVIGEALTAEEEEEWVDHFTGRLEVGDGRLLLCGGGVALMEPGLCTEDYHIFDIPPGAYRVDVYTYLHGINGDYCLNEAKPKNKGDKKLGRWFRNTRPDQELPGWLVWRCTNERGLDPGHREEYEDVDCDELGDWIDFVVRLTPLASGDVAEAPPTPVASDGWVPIAVQPRWPALCPLGLAAAPINAEAEEEQQEEIPAATFEAVAARAMLEQQGLALTPLDGGPVAIAPQQLRQVYRLAWMCHEFSIPQVEVHLPTGVVWEPEWPQCQRARVDATDDGWTIGCEGHVGSIMASSGIATMAPALTGLPDGTLLTLDCVVLPPEDDDDDDEEDPGLAGCHRYAGEVRGGLWHIDRTYPAVPAAALADALALSAQADGGEALLCRDEKEAREALKLAAKDGALCDQSPRRDGLRLMVDRAWYLENLAIHVLRVRHGALWPVYVEKPLFPIGDDED